MDTIGTIKKMCVSYRGVLIPQVELYTKVYIIGTSDLERCPYFRGVLRQVTYMHVRTRE